MLRSFRFGAGGILGLFLLASTTLCEAFLSSTSTSTHDLHVIISSTRRSEGVLMLQSSFSQEPPSPADSSLESIKSDIEAMKREAQLRLDALTTDLEEFRKGDQSTASTSYMGNDASSSVSLDCLEGDLSKVALTPSPSATLSDISSTTTAERTNDESVEEEMSNTGLQSPASTILYDHPTDVHLLEGTRVCLFSRVSCGSTVSTFLEHPNCTNGSSHVCVFCCFV